MISHFSDIWESTESSGRGHNQTKTREAAIARDGECAISQWDIADCQAAHLVPWQKVDVSTGDLTFW